MARRRCSECGGPLPPTSAPTRKTCSDACRGKRSRRLKAARTRAGEAKAMPEHQKVLEERVRDEVNDAIGETVQKELEPVVREAITEDVLRAVEDLVALTPDVVAAIKEDLTGDDPVLRQRAYSLIAKYTIGHPAILRPEDAEQGQQLVVNFGMPRPDSIEAEVQEPEATDIADDAIEEVKPCDRCGVDKPLAEFVVGSDRCKECYSEQRHQAAELIQGRDSGSD